MAYRCDMKIDGTDHPCWLDATHQWGKVKFCCHHFDVFVIGMYELEGAVRTRRHLDIVEEYESKSGKTSHVLGTDCSSDPQKDKK